jgi:hypothetical protein
MSVIPPFIPPGTEITRATIAGVMEATLAGVAGTTLEGVKGTTSTEGITLATGAVGTMAANITTAATTLTTRPSL